MVLRRWWRLLVQGKSATSAVQAAPVRLMWENLVRFDTKLAVSRTPWCRVSTKDGEMMASPMAA
jgi:hypothetical protein